MPPMVLYRTRGWTDIMRGSRVAMLAVLMSDLERWVSLKSAEFAGAKGGRLRGGTDEVGGREASVAAWTKRQCAHDAVAASG